MNAFLKGKKANLAGRASTRMRPGHRWTLCSDYRGLSFTLGGGTYMTDIWGSQGEAVGAASEWQGHE